MRAMEPMGNALVASTAVVEGDVRLGAGVSVWWSAVLRGDDAPITIGEQTNVQDLVMVHADIDDPMVIGRDVTIGHHAVLHGRTIGDRVLIGIGAILLAGTEIGDDVMVAAGAVVPENMVVPPRVLLAGVPAKIKRDVRPDEIAYATERAARYWHVAQERAG